MNYNTISAQRIAGALGAEIAGVDLSRPLSDEVIGEIRQALLDHQVIFFHDQHLTPEQHLAFGRRFGELQIHDFVEPAEEDQHILEVRKEEQRLGFVMEPRFLRGAALSAHGAFDEAVACLREALAGGLGARTFRPYGFTRLAEALASQGQHRAAIAAVKEGMGAQEETAALRWGAELHRLEGVELVGLNRLEEGQKALEEALRVARGQQAKAYELRAATNLAQLWGEQGRRAEARDLLAPVYGWFTEGFDTSDLKGAKALLDELA